MKVSANDRGIEHHPFQVRVLQRVKDSLPDALLGPATEPLKDAVPLTESFRQVAPRRSRPHDPQHGVEEQPIVLATATCITRFSRQQVLQPLPLLVRQLKPPHDNPPP